MLTIVPSFTTIITKHLNKGKHSGLSGFYVYVCVLCKVYKAKFSYTDNTPKNAAGEYSLQHL